MAADSSLLSREELHQLVWSVPGTHLAKRFGLSDSGLSKICRKLDVPRPPLGWWAKKAAGHRVRISPLPNHRSGVPERVTITPTPDDTSGLREAIKVEAKRIGEIIISERLTRPHPLIARWLAERLRRQTEGQRERDLCRRNLYRVPDFTSNDRRRHRVLQALFRALERQGAMISETDRGQLNANFEEEAIQFELREKLRQVTRSLTDEEKRWETWNRSGLRKELEPTGFFQFTISAWTEQPVRKVWLESPRQPIETLLPTIVATFTMLAPVLAERSRRRAEEARRFAEEQRKAEEERQRRREDDNRWGRFVEIAGNWKQAALAREFIEALRAGGLGTNDLIEGRSVSQWVEWADARATAMDPIRQGPDRLFSEVGAVRAWTFRD